MLRVNPYPPDRTLTMRLLASTLLLAAGLTACAASTAQLRTVSSGKVGCAPDAITVADYKLGTTTSSWTATCGGKTYYCSGDDMLKSISCAGQ